jgi:hypothetical protein
MHFNFAFVCVIREVQVKEEGPALNGVLELVFCADNENISISKDIQILLDASGDVGLEVKAVKLCSSYICYLSSGFRIES